MAGVRATTGRSRTGGPVDAPATRVWVDRPALMHLLDTAASRPLTLVVAPAGAGKTLTLARWSKARAGTAVQWVSSGSGMVPGRLANIIRAAAGLATAPSANRPQTHTLVARTAAALAEAESQQIVVVDDAHLMSSGCFELLDELLNTCPAALRLVLLCRWDPPIARLVPSLRGDLSVIRGDAFRMSDEEAARLVLAHVGPLPDQVVRRIVARARGWAAVVVLASHTVAASPDPLRAVERLTETDVGVADLLASQVFATLSGEARHVLLCLASEADVDAETAARLSSAPAAEIVLAEMEASGLLVSAESADGCDRPARYRIHPLLSEVLRRRLAADGDEVAHARAVVLHAARWDVRCGDVEDGLRRMVAVRAWEDAVSALSDRGVELMVRGQARRIRTVAAAASELVENVPRAWPTLALERWHSSDHPGAERWLDRIESTAYVDAERRPRPVDVALLRLLLAKAGREPAADAIENALRVIHQDDARWYSAAAQACLLIELGAAENWTGHLAEADAHLRWAATTAESGGFPALTASALSHLALTEYMRGRHHNCHMLAARALDVLAGTENADRATIARVHIAQELSRPHDPGEGPAAFSSVAGSPSLTDPATTLWNLIVTSRRLLANGSVDEASSVLDLHVELPPLPAHLSAVLTVERCRFALLRNDETTLARLVVSLNETRAEAEAAVARALCRDLAGQPEAASALLRTVIDGEVEAALPETTCVALVFSAQLLDSRGERAMAEERMHQAIGATAAQRSAEAFVAWSATGTPTADLLRRVAHEEGSRWALELCDVAQTSFARNLRAARPAQPSVHHPATVPAGRAHVPALTRREHDVLEQLANGSSYRDIAETLFVSENTVKTHVSSLYAKLGATRRSQALKIARARGVI